jgi:hypothetical protein
VSDNASCQELWLIDLLWINCELGSIRPASIASINQNKTIWSNQTDLSFIPRISKYHQLSKPKTGILLRFTASVRTISPDLNSSRETRRGFYCLVARLTYPFRVTGKSFRLSDLFGGPQFRMWMFSRMLH